LSEAHPERRRSKLYGRRKGPKLSGHQAGLRETLLPSLTLDLGRLSDPRAVFDVAVEEVWLEVGYGAGEHLLWQVQQHPNIGIIGAEPYESGVAKLLSKLEDAPAECTRIRLHEGDARDIIARLPEESIGRVFILFPDPWPKTRHHKRRFIQSELLDDLASILKGGGELRFASDDAGYVEWALERLTAHPAFRWTAASVRDWTERPGDWPPTRYEEKALHGPPAYLRFVRRDRLAS
jgi:tRNA (guanine-N7-)-methyltransferase